MHITKLTSLDFRSALCHGLNDPAELDQFCRLDETGKQLMRSAMQQLAITARAFHRILKLG
ncbi:MAG: hypothetical protein JXA42_13505, partial [Anaerolineales bacterium]|nr:hypothetical protein [Anaerolineales bacterium]